jgi:hypothetical protein
MAKTRKSRRLFTLEKKPEGNVKEQHHAWANRWNERCRVTDKCASNERFSCDDCDEWRDALDFAQNEYQYDVNYCRKLRDSCCRKWDYTWLVALLSVVIGLMVIAFLATIARGIMTARAAADSTESAATA